MSRFSYAGEYQNPVENFIVVPKLDGDGFAIGVKVTSDEIIKDVFDERISVDEAREIHLRGYRFHSENISFDDEDEAYEWIEDAKSSFEDDYDDYLEENRDSLAQMERYDQFMNEY